MVSGNKADCRRLACTEPSSKKKDKGAKTWPLASGD